MAVDYLTLSLILTDRDSTTINESINSIKNLCSITETDSENNETNALQHIFMINHKVF